MVPDIEGGDGSGRIPSASKRRLASSRAQVWILWHAELVSTVTLHILAKSFQILPAVVKDRRRIIVQSNPSPHQFSQLTLILKTTPIQTKPRIKLTSYPAYTHTPPPPTPNSPKTHTPIYSPTPPSYTSHPAAPQTATRTADRNASRVHHPSATRKTSRTVRRRRLVTTGDMSEDSRSWKRFDLRIVGAGMGRCGLRKLRAS